MLSYLTVNLFTTFISTSVSHEARELHLPIQMTKPRNETPLQRLELAWRLLLALQIAL
jgi:hypothetical protein